MSSNVSEWLSLLLRWFHILAGISWIGSSFYFMWLDSHLAPPAHSKEGVTGELWMVHSGGFYQVEKRLIAPGQMPSVLHWFKWEAFFTWLSGIFLLGVVYYLGGGIYLVDQSVANIGIAEARTIGIGLLVISWLVYDGIWISPLGKIKNFATALCVLLTGLVIYGLSRVFSGRAAFIHVGAMFGTLMVANVWMRILPAQRQMIAATERGEKPDYTLGARAKIRSVHNNYMTFPLIFIMISNHFPSTYGTPNNWIILTGLIVASAAVRHVMNKRTVQSRWLLLPAAAIVAALFVMTSPHSVGRENLSREGSTENTGTAKTFPVGSLIPDDSKAGTGNPSAETGGVATSAPTNGTIQGKVVYKGRLPDAEPISFPAGCAEQYSGPVTNPSVKIQAGRLQNVFVTITGGLENKKFPVASKELIIDQKGCMYSPLVLGAQVGQRVTFLNSDPVFHNVRSLSESNPVFNEGMQNRDMRVTKVFNNPEIMVHVHCDVHPWMNAFIGVVSHPYFAVTDSGGNFNLNDVPPGKYVLTAWHEIFGKQSQTVIVDGKGVGPITFVFTASSSSSKRENSNR